ncbi:hypothetical protein R3P38DRAFT_2415245, partial [Favolaschia claudopus]
ISRVKTLAGIAFRTRFHWGRSKRANVTDSMRMLETDTQFTLDSQGMDLSEYVF